ncbi:MAG: twin transmembrane helix small protein [Oceanicaulis sp.]
MLQFIDILLYVLLAAVFVILAAGIYALFRGGDFGRSWSNRLMRLRVLFQFVAVLVIVAGFWLKNQLAGG